MAENERVWVITEPNVPEWVTRNKDEADRAHAAGHKVESYFPPSPEPDPKAPLHSVAIKAKDSSPFSAEILIDGRQSDTIQSIKVEMGTKHANRVTIVFEPENLEIDGVFEGWVENPGRAEAVALLQRIRDTDTDEQTSDGALGSLARQALDHLVPPTGGPTRIVWPDPKVRALLQEISAGRLQVTDITPQQATRALADWPYLHRTGGSTDGKG